MTQVFASIVVEIENKDGKLFKVNGQRIKHYIGQQEEVKLVKLMYLDELTVIKIPESCRDVKSSASGRQSIICCKII